MSQALIARIARKHMASMSWDIFARLSVLERFAGVKPGLWINQGRRGLASAFSHLPGIDPLWTTSKDTGLYHASWKTADQWIHRFPFLKIDADDLLQDALVSSASSAGNTREKLFYAVGMNLATKAKSKMDDGRIPPKSTEVLGPVKNWIYRRVLNEAKIQSRKKETGLGVRSESGDRTVLDFTPDSIDESTSFALAMAQDTTLRDKIFDLAKEIAARKLGPKKAAMYQLLMDKVRNFSGSYREVKNDSKIVKSWFAQAAKASMQEIADELQVSRQNVLQVLGGGASNVLNFMEDVVANDPRVQSLRDKIVDRIDLLEGAHGMRLANLAPRLDPKLRRVLNDALDRAGFGGRGRWMKVGHAIAEAFRVLGEGGIEMDQVISGHLLNRDSGSLVVDLAFTNDEDPFSPVSIRNSVLHIQYTKLQNNQFEVVAYLS